MRGRVEYATIRQQIFNIRTDRGGYGGDGGRRGTVLIPWRDVNPPSFRLLVRKSVLSWGLTVAPFAGNNLAASRSEINEAGKHSQGLRLDDVSVR